MREPSKTKRALANELESLKQRIRELEQAESERKSAYEALRESEEYFKAIIQNSSDIIFIVDKLGAITYASPSIERFLGYRPDELIGKRTLDLIVSDDKPRAIADFGRALLTKEVPIPNVFRIRHKNGTERILEGIGNNLLDNPIVAGFVMNVRDITERRKVEEALREREDRLAKIVATVPGAVCSVRLRTDGSACFLYGSERFAEYYGVAPEHLAEDASAIFSLIHTDDVGHMRETIAESARTMKPWHCEWRVHNPVRGELWLECHSMPLREPDGSILWHGVVTDITERKLTEQEMVIITEIGRVVGSTLEIDEVYKRMAAEIRKLILFDSMRINLVNAQQETLTVAYVSGLDIPGRKVGESYPMRGTVLDEVIRTRRGMIVQSEHPEDLIDKFPSLNVSVRAGMRSIMSVPLISRDELIGSLIMRSKKPVAYTERDLRMAERIGAQIAGAIANAQIYNDLKETEKSLRESEGQFRSLFEQAAVGVAEIETSTGRFFTVNRRLCEMVGRTEEELLATTFHMFTHPEDLHLHEEKMALLLAGKIEHYSLEKRYLRKDGEIVWVNITVSPLWKPGETSGCNMIVVEDITERKKAEKQLQHTLESLRAAVNTTIQVMVSAVETRDPYTAGHQIRSADLARTIATEMGLPQEKIDAIRMAGSIHDIGKLSIPAEILSKPTKLTEIEFSLIKEHANQGYEMLKNVKSPWPLAEIVHQHHERMDGSGYPRNLKGDEICTEARILAVADVVEAMASHRPYRPGLGIDAALNEIEKNRGIFYDNTVAEACLRLFREKGFQLTGT